MSLSAHGEVVLILPSAAIQIPANDPAHNSDFTSIVRTSLLRHSTHKALCTGCGKQFTSFETRRSIATKDLPPLLALNAAVFSEESLRYWRDGRQRHPQGQAQTQHFVQTSMELRGQINGVDDSETATYILRVSNCKLAFCRGIGLYRLLGHGRTYRHKGRSVPFGSCNQGSGRGEGWNV